MTKQEVLNFTKKIKAYYKTFVIDDADVMQEWIDHLQPYSKEDIYRKFEEHLNGDNSLNPPMLHILTKNLMTEEMSSQALNDYIIRCDLCGREMPLKVYDNSHRDKCLTIKALIKVLGEKGENVTYEELDKYDAATLDKIWFKYVPINKKMSW